MKRRLIIAQSALALGLALTASQPVAAQYMPHLDPNLYAGVIMSMQNANNSCGPMSQSEIDEARLPAPGIMQAYFDAAQSGEAISSHFKLSKETKWSLGTLNVGRYELDEQSDPLAVPGNRLDPDTLRFFRAGTHQTAMGQWLVLGSDGDVVGVYNAMFERQRGDWRLLQIRIFQADDLVAPLMHYCSDPGDLTDRRLTALTEYVAQLERRVASRSERLEQANEKLHEAQERLALRPDRASLQRRVLDRRRRADQRRRRLEDATTQLAEAREKRAEASEEFAAVRALTTQARNARDFRLIDLDGKPLTDATDESGQ